MLVTVLAGTWESSKGTELQRSQFFSARVPQKDCRFADKQWRPKQGREAARRLGGCGSDGILDRVGAFRARTVRRGPRNCPRPVPRRMRDPRCRARRREEAPSREGIVGERCGETERLCIHLSRLVSFVSFHRLQPG